MESRSFKLDIEPEKKPVFVTQLIERDDEEDSVVAYPVVKESGSRLLETGVRTLQKTLVLKQEVEVDRVQAELNVKREEFRKRMEACAQRQVEVQKKQQMMKDKVSKFEKFIQENEAKRRRAIQKYQTEVKLREQKNREYEALCQQLAEIRSRQVYLANKLAKYKKYQDFLMKVLEIMPENYIEMGDNPINSLMMRHRTLHANHKDLLENLDAMDTTTGELKSEMDGLVQEHNSWKLSTSAGLSQKQHGHEKKTELNKETELHIVLEKGVFRNQATELGRIMIAIDNIAEKCLKRVDPPLEDLGLEEKLRKIEDQVRERGEVARTTTAAVKARAAE